MKVAMESLWQRNMDELLKQIIRVLYTLTTAVSDLITATQNYHKTSLKHYRLYVGKQQIKG